MRVRFGSWIVAACFVAGTANAGPIDLGTWTAESYQVLSTHPDGVWTVAAGGTSVSQSVNGQPTLFYGNFTGFGTKVTGNVRAGATDDDYMGFALGVHAGDSTNASAKYLLIDWKQGLQVNDFGTPSNSPGGPAQAGLAVSEVTGVPDADEFWQHKNLSGTPLTSGLQELARAATLGSTGWSPNTDYTFTFDFGPNDLEVFVNGVKQIDITGSFTNGSIAFYNFSQPGVTYSAFDVGEGSFPGTALPEPATVVIFGAGLAGLGLMRRRRKLIGQSGEAPAQK